MTNHIVIDSNVLVAAINGQIKQIVKDRVELFKA